MVKRTTSLVICSLLVVLLAVACGGDDGASLPDRLTARAGDTTAPVGTSTSNPSTPESTPASQVTPQPSLDAATNLQIQSLRRLVLSAQDLPAGFDALNNQEAQRDAIIAAQAGIPELQSALTASDLLGGWATLYSRLATPATFVSSIAYLFGSPEGAASFVDANAGITVADYPSAIEADEVPTEPVGEASVLMRYRTPEGYAYELTWAQGPVAGQVIVRYPEEHPGDAAQVVSELAAIQGQRLATFVP